MRSGLYAHLVRLSFGFYDRHQTGQLMSRATVDLQGVRFFLGYGLIFFFQNVLTVLSVTVVLFFVQWELALIPLATTPLLVALAYRYSHVAHPTLRDVQQRLADVSTVAEENIVGVHVVKAFAQEPAEEEKFRNRSELRVPADAAGEQAARDVRPAHLGRAAARTGGGAARRCANGDRPHADSGKLRVVQPLPRAARHPAARARHVDRPVAARHGVGRAHLRDHRRARGDRRSSRRPAASPRSRPHPVRRALVRVRARPAGAARHRPRHTRRDDDRADRAHRLGQDDSYVARPALLRRNRRQCLRRRCRRARRHARIPAARDRRHLAGSLPLLRDRPREHRVRPPRALARGDRGALRGQPRRTSSSRSSRTATTR